jgi:hypothetical protein
MQKAYEIEIYNLKWESDKYKSLPTKIYKRLFVFDDIEIPIKNLSETSPEMIKLRKHIEDWLEKEQDAHVVSFDFKVLNVYIVKEEN